MDINILERIKEDYARLRYNAIQYLTKERNIYEEVELTSKDTYELFSMFLDAYVPRLYADTKTEASCLPAAITTQLALSLGWMDSKFNLLGKAFMGTIWGVNRIGGSSYRRFIYSSEEQREIIEHLAKHNIQ